MKLGGGAGPANSLSVFPEPNEVSATRHVPDVVPETQGAPANTQCGPGGVPGQRGWGWGRHTDETGDHTSQCVIVNHTKCHPGERVLNFAFTGIFLNKNLLPLFNRFH